MKALESIGAVAGLIALLYIGAFQIPHLILLQSDQSKTESTHASLH
jgi:hypothetical protein